MSAVAGILRLDGAPAETSMLRAMLEALSHRSPGGSRMATAGSLALGHGSLATTPEASGSEGPADYAGVLISADVRLDNRQELQAALQISEPNPTDAKLIVAAYRRWGEACTDRLLGDFMFALWDEGARRLFCARDHVGVKPLFYFCDSRSFVFASEIKAILATGPDRFRMREGAIGEFLADLPGDGAATQYNDILRLPGGHRLSVVDGKVRTSRYWSPGAGPGVRSSDAASDFRDIFVTAVQRRMRSPVPAVAMLSGGLDSSSITCVAAPYCEREFGVRLPTISGVFDETPELNERPYIEEVLRHAPCDPEFLDYEGAAPFADLDATLREQDGLFFAPGLHLTRKVYRRIALRGQNIAIDGHGGDEVVSHGFGRLTELASRRAWYQLWVECRGVGRLYGEPPAALLLGLFNRHGAGRHLRPARRMMARGASLLGLRRSSQMQPNWSTFVNPSFSELPALREKFAATNAEIYGDERERHAADLASPRHAVGFEVLDRAAAFAGVEPRYPFWDRDLVEFCVGLPADEKLRDGWTRSVLRRAMEGVLPKAVQWRTTKLDFTQDLVRGFLRHHRAMIEAVLHDRGALSEYVDLAAVSGAFHRIAARPETAWGADVQAVWRTVVLSRWLHQHQATAALQLPVR